MSKNKLWQIFVSVFSLSILIISANSQETYSQNFDDFDNGETDLGDGSVIFGEAASIQDGRLQLTIDGQGLGFSSFSVPPIEGSSQGFTITFDYEMFDSPANNDPADGFSINYGDAELGAQGAAEEGMNAAQATENLSFEIDTWQNGDAEQGVNISGLSGGADLGQLAFTNGVILDDGQTVSGTVEISWDPSVGASFKTTGLNTDADFENVEVPDFIPSDDHTFIISARVGGANQDLFIDNLNIVTGAGDDDDEDGLPNTYEIANNLDPNDATGDNGADGDPDGDGLINLEEFENRTNPQNADTDGDGLADGVESATGIFVGADDTGTEPLDDDSDGDGLPDGEEVSADPFATNPNEADTDGDQLGDSLELELGTDPLDQASGPDGDADSDGSSNLDEVLTGTNPNNEDTDGDGLVDGVETNTGVFISESDTGSNPLNTDSDSDGLTDRVEVEIHATNPNEADSDGDGRDDAVEIEAGSDPNDALSRSRMPQPTGYWSFDDQGAGGVTADLSGAGNEGTLNGGPEIVEGPCGPGDFALKFDGLDDSVTTGVSLFTGGDTFTMSGWIRFETAQIGDRIGLFGQNDAVEFGLINPTTLQHWSNVGGALDATVAASSPEWMHLAVTGTSRERVLYVNGVAEANVGPSSAGSSSTFSFNIGGSGIFDNSGNWFRGEIDDVAVWDQVLAPDEIALLASCAISPLGSPRSDVGIEITEFARTPAGQISISWKSRADKQYDILSHPNLSVAREDWAEVAGAQDIRGDASGISSVSLAPPFEGSGYLAVREESLPPLFEDDFETDTGWVAIVNDANGNTNWERGTPNGSTGPLSGADDSINAWSTNLGDFGIDSDISLRSPAIDLTGVAAAELSFDAYRDGDGFGEFASIRFLRALDQSQLGEESAIDMTLFDSDWVAQTIPVVPEAIGESVVIEFNFVSDSSPDAFSGLSIDNVRMATP